MPKVRVVRLGRESIVKANDLLRDKDKMRHLEDVMTSVSGFISRVISDTEFKINTNGPVQKLRTEHPAPEVQEGQYVRAYFLKAKHAHYKEISSGEWIDGKLALLAREKFNETEQPYKICLVETLAGKEIESHIYFDEHFDPAKITSV
jgi:hypothetical protein